MNNKGIARLLLTMLLLASTAFSQVSAFAEEAFTPIVVEHALGETVISKKPERIVTIAWENDCTPLALGIAPVGVSQANYGLCTENRLHPWADEAFKALGVDNPNVFDDTDGWDYEAIADAQPDIILASYSGLTQEEYELLSQIAPVVAYPRMAWQTTWREQTLLNATAMGMKEEGEQLVAQTDALIAEKLAAHPELSGIRTAFCWISANDFSNFYVYLPTDPRAAFLNDLNLPLPESVAKMAEENPEAFSITVSRENAELLSDVEMIVCYGDPSMLTALQADALMNAIPAIQNGAVVFIEETSALAGGATPSILSIPYNLDTYLDLLSSAAANL